MLAAEHGVRFEALLTDNGPEAGLALHAAPLMPRTALPLRLRGNLPP